MTDGAVASSDSPKRQHNGFLVTVSAILTLLRKRATRKPKHVKTNPKKLLSNRKKVTTNKEEDTQGWGNGGVWQKEILMGGKCEPLNFSGVIYYDGNGKQLSEIPPRSPRASPLPGYLTRHTPQ
ncbi:hypothetical protein VNO78_23605 [Psophocarpus tetragonolobus]|uniref:Uncharacterized protein n=1 Tax=Psophocarpus tetragonolobus TaxID=3891 RepID=A0AAN9S3W7_PSOTE